MPAPLISAAAAAQGGRGAADWSDLLVGFFRAGNWGVLLIGFFALPAVVAAVTVLVGFVHRRSLAAAMVDAAQRATAVAPASEPSGMRVGKILSIEAVDTRDRPVVGEMAADRLARARHATRAAGWGFLAAGALLAAVWVAVQVWLAPPDWRVRVLPLVALLMAFPCLIVLLGATARSRRTWLAALAVYTVTVGIAVAWAARPELRHLKWVGMRSSMPAVFYAMLAIGAALLLLRRLRPLVAVCAALVVWLGAEFALGWLISTHLDLDPTRGVEAILREADPIRWSHPVNLALLWIRPLAGVAGFYWLLRARRRRFVVATLVAVALAAYVVQWLNPVLAFGLIVWGALSVTLLCGLTWLVFKGFVALESTGWLPQQALQFHLCWAYLTFFALLFVSYIPGASSGERTWAWIAITAGFAAYIGLLHTLLRRARCVLPPQAPKRLLLLRVFGAASPREQLLDVLDDTWRRVGRIDLIAGTDLAMRTFASLAVEALLLRRSDARFLKVEAEVDARLADLRDRLEGDLRYPVNEICCYATVWQTVVVRLARASDAVLLDLRGFTRANAGCVFELETVVRDVPLDRVVVLVDERTDEPALRAVAQAAWNDLGADSANAAANRRTRLLLLRLDGRAALDAVPPAVFRAAFGDAGAG